MTTVAPDIGGPLSLFPAALVVLRRGDAVLLQRRQNTGYMDGRWAVGVAGKVEHGESVIDTAVRETREEAGVIIDRLDLALLTVMHCTDGTRTPLEQRVNWFFECWKWDGVARICEPHKCAALQWCSLSSLPESMPPHELHALSLLREGRLPAVSTYGFAWDSGLQGVAYVGQERGRVADIQGHRG